jgi:hypothetical protein
VFCVMLSYLDYTEGFPVLGSYSAFICIFFFFLVCSLCRSAAVYMHEHHSIFYVVCTCVSGRMKLIFYTLYSTQQDA